MEANKIPPYSEKKHTGERYSDEPDSDQEDRSEALDRLGIALAGARAEAIDGREQSGIESDWAEDEEYYEGVDEANRGEMRAWRTKPPGQADLKAESTTSTVFGNITRPYCDASSAKIGDMLMPTDERGWEIKPTPIPEMSNIIKGKFTPKLAGQIEGYFEKEGAEDPQQAAQEKMQELSAQAKAESEDTKAKAEKAQQLIDDWHVEGQFQSVMRSVIEDASIMGSGVIKGPVPCNSKEMVFLDGKLQVENKIKPISIRIDCWNFYPDPGCGTNIHNGSYTWERDDISPKNLNDLHGVEGYIDEQIDKVLRQGPHQVSKVAPTNENETANLAPRDKSKLFEIWYYNGQITKADVENSGLDLGQKEPGEGDIGQGDEVLIYNAQITMVNNHVIMANLNILDTGDFPYDIMVWQKRKGMPWGRGVARQIRVPQRIVNGALRNMMDNAGRAGGPQVIVQRGVVEPINGKWEITPWAFWVAAEDADTESIENAFRFVTIDMLQRDLQAIIELGLRMAEDVTGLPMLMQGQTGPGTPDTKGGMQIVNANASTVLRRLARLWDDLITEPHIRRYYRYLMQHYGDDDKKGDLSIDARGSSALVEREIESASIKEMIPLSQNPIYGIDPKKITAEYLRSKQLTPSSYQYDDEEWQQIVAKLSEKQPDSRLEVAQINNQTKQALAEIIDKLKRDEMAMDDANEEKDRQLQLLLSKLEDESKEARLAGDTGMSFDKIKAMLTETMMKLKVQERMATQKQVIEAPTEPPGKAKKGEGYAS